MIRGKEKKKRKKRARAIFIAVVRVIYRFGAISTVFRSRRCIHVRKAIERAGEPSWLGEVDGRSFESIFRDVQSGNERVPGPHRDQSEGQGRIPRDRKARRTNNNEGRVVERRRPGLLWLSYGISNISNLRLG